MAQEKFDSLFSIYSSLHDELAPRRTQVVQTGEEASESSRSDICTTAIYILIVN